MSRWTILSSSSPSSCSISRSRCGVAGGLAPQDLEHLGGELARVHERLEDGLAERFE